MVDDEDEGGPEVIAIRPGMEHFFAGMTHLKAAMRQLKPMGVLVPYLSPDYPGWPDDYRVDDDGYLWESHMVFMGRSAWCVPAAGACLRMAVSATTTSTMERLLEISCSNRLRTATTASASRTTTRMTMTGSPAGIATLITS